MKISIFEKSCERCDSVYSPAAYLLALIRFIEHYFSVAGGTKDMKYLFTRIHRPYLCNLEITCDEIQKKIPQPQIVKKVLLNYIIYKTMVNDDEGVFNSLILSLNPPPFSYYGSLFKEYLHVLGTSLEEIHSIFIKSSTKSSEYLSEKLGISNREFSLIIEPTINPAFWNDIRRIMLIDINEEDIPNQDLEFFKNLFNIRDRIEELDIVLNNLEGKYKTPFDFLLDIVGVELDASSINISAFRKMFQFNILMKILKMDIVDLLILLKQLDLSEFTYDIIEKVHNIHSMLLYLDLSPSSLLQMKDDELKYEKIANILHINKETLEEVLQLKNLSDITKIPEFYQIWQVIHELDRFDISAEIFFRSKISLVNFTPEPITEVLGFTEEEILNAIDSEDTEKLIEVLGVSQNDLEFLFSFNICNPVTIGPKIENPSVLSADGLTSLDLLYRPFRLASFLGLDLDELQYILQLIRSETVSPEEINVIIDPNSISYETILKALKIVRFVRKIGLNVRETSLITKKCTDIPQLKEIMGIDDEWWEDYKGDSKNRSEKLAEQLNYSKGYIERFINSQGASERHYITQIISSHDENQNPLEISELSNDLDMPQDQTFYVVFVRGSISRDFKDWKLYNPHAKSYYTILHSGEYKEYNVFLIEEEPKDLFTNNIVEIIESDKDLSWIKIDDSRTLRIRTDIVRRWIALAQETKNDLNILYSSIMTYDIDFDIDDVNNFYEVCLITFALFDLNEVISLFNWSIKPSNNEVRTFEQVEKAYQILNLSKYLDLDLSEIENLNIWEHGVTKDNVSYLYGILENHFEEDQFNSEIKKAEESILESTRDALLYFAISPNFPSEEPFWPQTVKSLSDELLIDLQVSKNVYTNEILQTIESLQTYILRVKNGLESIDNLGISDFLDFINSLESIADITDGIIDDISHGYGDQISDYGIGSLVAERILETRRQLGGEFTDIMELLAIDGLGEDKLYDMFSTFRLSHVTPVRGDWWESMETDWKWMRRYVLWEAAQKVFLYPENWVMPELRDNKTPFFKELEEELSQGEVTQALAEKSVLGFIDNLHPLSSIHVSGTVYDKKENLLHIFARSLINERNTYYRSLKNQNIWSPWVKVPIEINSGRLYPFIAYNRLYSFWIETEFEEDDDGTTFKHKLCFSYSLDMKKWSKKITFQLKDSSNDLFTNCESPWLGVYNAGDILIHINDNPPLIEWDPETHPSCILLLTCQDNIDFVPSDYPLKISRFNLFDWDFTFPSNLNINPDSQSFFYKDNSSSEALMGYIDDRDELLIEQWKGKATLSKVIVDDLPVNLMNFLYCDGSTLKITSSKCEPFTGSGFEDSFDDNTLDNKWASFPKQGSITEEEGKLKLQNDGICDWWGRRVEWLSHYDAPHVITPIPEGYEYHWTAQVEISEPSAMSLANHYGLMLFKDLQNVWFFGHYCLTNPIQYILPSIGTPIRPTRPISPIGAILPILPIIPIIPIFPIFPIIPIIPIIPILPIPTPTPPTPPPPTIISNPQEELRIEKIVSNVSTENVRSISTQPDEMKYLRIGKFGDTYYFEYSSDGVSWNIFYSTNSLGFNPTHLGLFKKNWVHNTTIGAHFDNFSIYSVGLESNISLTNLTSKTIIENIDSTFKVDDAIVIGANSYFFCSDQHRCYIVIIRLDLAQDVITQNILIRYLNYGKYCKLKDKLFREGIDKFYHPSLQIEDLDQKFSEIYHIPSNLNIEAKCLPSQQIEFYGPNQLYNWELFFHIPNLIANELSQNRKFELAERWYKYIFYPYIRPEVQWKFRPFRAEIDEPFYSYIYDRGDIDIWRNDPFNPHALARVRPYTYQKAILLSYIENILEWADQDFTRDTQESINAARIRYLFVEQLLDLSEFEEEVPEEAGLRTLVTMNQASVEQALKDLNAADEDDNSNSSENLEFRGFLPDTWIEYIETLPDPYSLKAMLINTKVGCIPENPIFKTLLYQLKSNIQKIRTGRNIAGIKRILPLFEASIDPMAIISAVASGIGLENLNYSTTSNIGPYRFVFLIERAKSLAHLVVQTGNALLSAIEKKEAEELSYLKAQQELKLSKANIHLRKLRVIETQDSLTMAKQQTVRTQFIKGHYQDLINTGKNEHELSAINYIYLSIILLQASAVLQGAAAIAHLSPTISTTVGTEATVTTTFGGGNIANKLSTIANISSIEASTMSHLSSIASMNANFERRVEEWEFQQGLAIKDEIISKQNELIAQDRVKIAEMEQLIAEMQADFANETLEFLKEKFTNKDLYKWMVRTLSKLFYGFYDLAYTAARMAQATMEFERNESYDFISYGYWDTEKKGLLSGDQLLLDINRMDDAYINNNARKLEITKHISLAQMAPEAIIQLREKGKAIFTTPMSWYDRDFPGHYQRIIKSVKFSLLALIGPGTNVNATLSTISSSEVVLNTQEDPVLVPRIQSVALSGAANSTGLFELNYRDERYLPFEGSGVAVTWELEMPKASNKFNFETIIDAILTIDYTALSDFDYKKQIMEQLGTDSRGLVPISIRNRFPDAWYHFHNPIFTNLDNYVEPYSLVFNVIRPMFPPNEEEHKLEGISLKLALEDLNIRIPLIIKYTSEKGQVVEVSRSTDIDGTLSLGSYFNNKYPFGKWEISINRDRVPEILWARDEEGTPIMIQNEDQGNRSPKLNTDKINDLILGLTYKAKLEWPPQE